eukprot:CAMPEP_0180684174 /NCGR_PEP_ID=MMETSP1037_2-20121125/71640_1 /TAXON_ID=632150 /ORGANISM="Azadinium spinosum, Strain 3D9" /LENGTH=76 /DNA_ID=CAMNT_0022714597 /DNA_START=22 /DNA_END=249 /DNA_ORIENTATION=-
MLRTLKHAAQGPHSPFSVMACCLGKPTPSYGPWRRGSATASTNATFAQAPECSRPLLLAHEALSDLRNDAVMHGHP